MNIKSFKVLELNKIIHKLNKIKTQFFQTVSQKKIDYTIRKFVRLQIVDLVNKEWSIVTASNSSIEYIVTSKN